MKDTQEKTQKVTPPAVEKLRSIKSQQPVPANQQLKIANLQLQAREQQLRAANQQLRAHEEHLQAHIRRFTDARTSRFFLQDDLVPLKVEIIVFFNSLFLTIFSDGLCMVFFMTLTVRFADQQEMTLIG